MDLAYLAGAQCGVWGPGFLPFPADPRPTSIFPAHSNPFGLRRRHLLRDKSTLAARCRKERSGASQVDTYRRVLTHGTRQGGACRTSDRLRTRRPICWLMPYAGHHRNMPPHTCSAPQPDSHFLLRVPSRLTLPDNHVRYAGVAQPSENKELAAREPNFEKFNGGASAAAARILVLDIDGGELSQIRCAYHAQADPTTVLRIARERVHSSEPKIPALSTLR